jgi:hypothetical protein
MKKVALFAIVLALAVAGLTFAQAKPDFSGTWAPKVDANAAPPAGGGGRGGGMGPMTIKQTAAEMTITRGQNNLTYKLDGTESVNQGRGGEMKSTAKFDGAKLVIKTSMESPNGAMETTATYSLSADGKELTVVTASARGERTAVYTKQ